ncbi:hypothetical protein ATCC90586_006201 [Pythium insidiosum]|nr:hypothetical protein ATCC90586_006201 [Pythium insidiosum]
MDASGDDAPLAAEMEIPWLDSVDIEQLVAWMSDDSTDSDSRGHAAPAPAAPAQLQAATSTAIVAAKDNNSTRRRQKEELSYLRSRVVELEDDLTRLRASQLRPVDPQQSAEGADDDKAWEGIARRQRMQRQRAEIENYKLRQMLESQLRVAETLDRLLRKRPNLGTTDSRDPKRSRQIGDATDASVPDDAMFRRLLASVELSYATMHQTFEQNGLLTAPVGHRKVEIRAMTDAPAAAAGTHRHAKVFVEMTDVATVPFGLEATAHAAWHCITSGYMQVDHEVYTGLGQETNSDDMLAIKYAVTLSRRRLQVNMNARGLMKRYAGADEIVDVWDSSSVTSGLRAGSSEPGIQVTERGWTVLRRLGPSSTVVYTCMQMLPLVSYAQTSDEERQVGLLTNLALDYYGDQLDLAHQAIESLLLDTARR